MDSRLALTYMLQPYFPANLLSASHGPFLPYYRPRAPTTLPTITPTSLSQPPCPPLVP